MLGWPGDAAPPRPLSGLWPLTALSSVACGILLAIALWRASRSALRAKRPEQRPIAVIGALVFSLFEALFVLPAHLSHLPDPSHVKSTRNPIRLLDRRLRGVTMTMLDFTIERLYTPFIRGALQYRYLTLSTAGAVVLVTGGLMAGGFVQFVSFPNTSSSWAKSATGDGDGL